MLYFRIDKTRHSYYNKIKRFRYADWQKGRAMHTIDTNDIEPLKKNGYFFQHTDKRKLFDGLHSHTFYEFFYVASGSCGHIACSEERTLRAGSLVALAPGVAHKFTFQSKDTDIIAISVSSKEVEKILKFFGKTALLSSFCIEELSIDRRNVLLQQCRELFHRESDSTELCRLLVNQILLFVLSPSSKADMPPAPLTAALERFQSSDFAQIGIESLLSMSGYSHSQLCRLMQKHFGLTPTEYINRLRMKKAYDLVIGSDMSIDTICAEVGFESFSYFSKLFKKTYGCTLSRLRKSSNCRTV